MIVQTNVFELYSQRLLSVQLRNQITFNLVLCVSKYNIMPRELDHITDIIELHQLISQMIGVTGTSALQAFTAQQELMETKWNARLSVSEKMSLLHYYIA